MKPDRADEAKAKRAILAIYMVMGVGVVLPFVLWWFFRR